MILQSLRSSNQDSFGTPLWESLEKKPFECRCRGEVQETLESGGGATPSNIRKIQKVHGGEEAPPNGGTVLPKDA
jgi:hypothetical protein